MLLSGPSLLQHKNGQLGLFFHQFLLCLASTSPLFSGLLGFCSLYLVNAMSRMKLDGSSLVPSQALAFAAPPKWKGTHLLDVSSGSDEYRAVTAYFLDTLGAGSHQQTLQKPWSSTIVTTSITDRKKFSLNYFLQFLTGSLPEKDSKQINSIVIRAHYRNHLAVHQSHDTRTEIP